MLVVFGSILTDCLWLQVAYAVVKRTALRPDFIEETKTTGGGFVHLTAAGYAEAGATVRVGEVRMGSE